MDAPDELTIVLLGKTGAGKSSTGNSLIGNCNEDECFKTGWGQNATTVNVESKTGHIDKVKVKVVDTPGFFDVPDPDEHAADLQKEADKLAAKVTKTDEDYINLDLIRKQIADVKKNATLDRQNTLKDKVSEAVKAVAQTGVHAFFLIVSCEQRFDHSDHQTLQDVIQYFGARRFEEYTFIVLTHYDAMRNRRISEEKYKEKYMHGQVKLLVKRFGEDEKCIFVDNMALLQQEISLEQKTYFDSWRIDVKGRVLNNLARLNNRPYRSKYIDIVKLDTAAQGVTFALQKFEPLYKSFETKFQPIIDELKTYRKNTAKILVGSAGLSMTVGTGLFVAGILLAPLTFGGSISLAVVGGAISIGGASAGVGRNFWDLRKHNKYAKEGEKEIKELVDCAKVFTEAYLKYYKLSQEILFHHTEKANTEYASANHDKGGNEATSAFIRTSKLLFDVGEMGADAARIGLVGTTGAATTTITAATIVGPVMVGLGALVDLFTIGQVAHHYWTTRDNKEDRFKAPITLYIENAMKVFRTGLDEMKNSLFLMRDCAEMAFGDSHFGLSKLLCPCCKMKLSADAVPCRASRDPRHFSGHHECVTKHQRKERTANLDPTCPACTMKWPTDTFSDKSSASMCLVCFEERDEILICMAAQDDHHPVACRECFEKWWTNKPDGGIHCPICDSILAHPEPRASR